MPSATQLKIWELEAEVERLTQRLKRVTASRDEWMRKARRHERIMKEIDQQRDYIRHYS